MVRNAMKEGLPGWQAPACQLGATERRPDFNVARRFGSQPQAPRLPPARRGRRDCRGGRGPPDADGLRSLAERLRRHGQPVRAAIESMNGARFVHDQLELRGWQVEIADARLQEHSPGRGASLRRREQTGCQQYLADRRRRDGDPDALELAAIRRYPLGCTNSAPSRIYVICREDLRNAPHGLDRGHVLALRCNVIVRPPSSR
jgi:hypothetical protein